MINSALATASLLGSQYGLKSGDSLVSGLLSPQTATPFSGLSLLGGAAASETALTSFVQDYIPNNGQLLKDISAVFALQDLVGEGELPATAAFLNPYAKALALHGGGLAGDAGTEVQSALVSLLS